MCGIAGMLARDWNAEAWRARLGAMARAIAHRGPDDEGLWADAAVGVGLAHRRLSILDLSPAGHQPMASASGRFMVVYNGEIYNYLELRGELEGRGRRFRGGSDTEVLLEAVEEWGLEQALRRFRGMFAFAMWDRGERRLLLARDRPGIKPLYCGWNHGRFYFASELSALEAVGEFAGEIDIAATGLFFRHNYVPCPRSILRGISKLPPATYAVIHPEQPGEIRPIPYWSARAVALAGRAHPYAGSEEDAARDLEDLLRECVRDHMVADVPVGAFLSGGVDSSLVVALMQRAGVGPARTYSIGFHEKEYNEAGWAKAVAQHLGTVHTELYLTPGEVMEAIPGIAERLDEPFADSSQVPTWFVSRLARSGVAVSLSGDGGDELFSGYVRYLLGDTVWRRTRWLPGWARRQVASGLRLMSPDAWQSLLCHLPWRPAFLRQARIGEKMHRLADILGEETPRRLYLGMLSHLGDSRGIVPSSGDPASPVLDPANWPEELSFIEHMMLLDFLVYLPDDILTKVDRASMSFGLEARVPLLDHRVVEFAWSLPLAFKNRGGEGKRVLRRVLERHVPRALVERPKMGFGIPLGAWLRTGLRPWAESLLDEKRLREHGLLDAVAVSRLWQEHLSGRRDHQYLLWNCLIFQAWMGRRAPAPVAWNST